jgi:hypothetical protein
VGSPGRQQRAQQHEHDLAAKVVSTFAALVLAEAMRSAMMGSNRFIVAHAIRSATNAFRNSTGSYSAVSRLRGFSLPDDFRWD